MKDFKDIKIVNNFYQSSSFFPLPTTLIATLDENFETSFGAYSLIFPYYVITMPKHFKYMQAFTKEW